MIVVAARTMLASARRISEEVNRLHGQPLLDSAIDRATKERRQPTNADIDQLEELSLALSNLRDEQSGVDPFESLPKDSVILAELERLKKTLSNLAAYVEQPEPVQKVGETDAKFKQRRSKFQSSARVMRRAREILEAPRPSSEFGISLSLGQWFQKAPAALELATQLCELYSDDDWQDRFGSPTRSNHPERTFKSLLMGKHLLELFSMTYPGVEFGKRGGPAGDQEFEGAGFSFVHRAMIELGFEGITFDAIQVSINRIAKDQGK